ncbi:DNA primase [Roseimaritima multifibrata]|uniref:DNA primase n=1 Tax=Roseimaritima multifibrata TaxID=1930274 RepID=A0A517M963_9BACT|nr:toprim domain-containing protein [Roseimaritima multifibrata]QDS91414.1 DNA primase [Roseimaritima multifibrata]
MNINQAKQLPLSDVLERLGHAPTYRRGNELWYCSPLRNEAEPSFKINDRNQWYDFATGKHGDVLDLIQELNKLHTVKEALVELRRLIGEPMPQRAAVKKVIATRQASIPEITSVEPLRSHSLIRYLKSRGLDDPASRKQLREIRYTRDGKEYFAIGFANDRDCYELRTSRFKGSLGSKAISTRNPGSESVAVFEGFTDYLTAISRHLLSSNDTAVVMNSASLKEATVEQIVKLSPNQVTLWLDHDATGRQATNDLTAMLGARLPDTSVVDRSEIYVGYEDLNAFHTASLTGPIR